MLNLGKKNSKERLEHPNLSSHVYGLCSTVIVFLHERY